MEIKEFIESFAEANEIEDASVLTAETHFRELDEWSSLSVMYTIAMFDELFDKELTVDKIKSCTTIQELYNLSIA